MVRRALSVFLALTFTLAAPAQARAAAQGATAADPAAVDVTAGGLFEAGKYLQAAKVWEDALAAVPETLEVRGQRNDWVIGAVNAYKAAFDADPTQCSALRTGLELADAYLAGLVAVYGLPVKGAGEYLGASERRSLLKEAGAGKGCEELAPVRAGGDATPSEPPGPASGDSAGPPNRGRSSEARPGGNGLAAGIGVSAALGLVMVGTSLALYFPLRKDGRRYQAIVAAAEMADVPTNDSETDICVAGAAVSGIADACAKWDSQYRGMVATSVLAGLFAVSTAVFTGLLLRRRHKDSAVASTLREHQVQFGAAPRFEGGAVITGSLRF